MNQTLGKRIMTNRKRLELTQDQLAEKLGVTAQAVSKWENDQSCPDISMLPQLAEIFGISTDTLLGRTHQESIPEAKPVFEQDEAEPEGLHAQVGNLEFSWGSNKKESIGFAVLVLTVGILFLLSKLFIWDISFWNILWPTSLLVFGLLGLVPKFSLFRLGCALLGGYFLAFSIIPPPFEPDSEVIIAIIILLIGISLLVDSFKNPRKNFSHFGQINDESKKHKQRNMFWANDNSFTYSASFGECTQYVELPRLTHGEVNISFGEYDLDLSGVETVSDGCTLTAKCSFGELTLQIPKRFTVKQKNSAAFAEILTSGHPDECPEGVIFLDSSANFGAIKIQYI